MTLSLNALPGRIVTLQDHPSVRSNAEHDGYAEAGMQARVISTRVMDDEVAVLRLNLKEFAAHNRTCESPDYRMGHTTVTATEAGKAEDVEDLHIMLSDLEHAIKVVDAEDPIFVAYLAREDQDQSYAAFLEGLVRRAIEEHGFDPAAGTATADAPK